MVAKPGVLVIVPSNSSVHRCRPFLGRVPRVGSPAPSVLLRHSDSPSLVLASLRFLVRRYPSPGRSRSPRKQQGLPGSWGSLVYMPCSRTPVGPPCRVLARLRAPASRYCLPLLQRRRLPQRYFGALSHGLHTRCLRFAVRGRPPVHARLASGWGPALTGRATISRVPLGSIVRFRCQLITSSLPKQCSVSRHAALPGARRVAPVDCPGAPTDPDMRDYRIRLFDARARYAGRTRLESCGFGSGCRSSSRSISFQLRKPFWERRPSHRFQMRRTSS